MRKKPIGGLISGPIGGSFKSINLELKPMTKEEIREARINSYPPVF